MFNDSVTRGDSMKRRDSVTRRVLMLVFVAFFGLCSVGARAQMPNKPITLIVPFAACGNLDIVARLIAPGLAKELGQSVVVQIDILPALSR